MALPGNTTTATSPPADPGYLSNSSSDFNINAPPTPPRDNDGSVVAKAAGKVQPGIPADGSRNQRVGIPDRRRSQRPISGRQGSGDSYRRGKGLGPRIPIKVSPAPTPAPAAAQASAMSMADVRNGMRLQDDDLTPDESSVGGNCRIRSCQDRTD